MEPPLDLGREELLIPHDEDGSLFDARNAVLRP